MSEFPPPADAGDAAVGAPQALTPERIAAALADFQGWLLEASRRPVEAPPPVAEESPDLHTLLGQFLALRHEVNLQTKATRTQQELNAETLRQLTAALESLRAARADGEAARKQEHESLLRPLLKTLIDLFDALAVAGREVERVQDAVLPTLAKLGLDESSPVPSAARRAWWAPWRAGPVAAPDAAARQARHEQVQEQLSRVRQSLASLVSGYTMSLQRVERALRQHGLEPIVSVGETFDPERMEAVEAVAGSDAPSGRVLDEVRRGYTWNGRVFRFAQVRVAKS